ncbi:TonB-linked SusC/RagA family outer membrane protein [Flavobacteriaceae bacterium MAR_2010_72]|nr:TonB-linked SusC/RagA family outer membrane protein [Flavobacteriaceae bacterium MAR_2010_72]
MNTKILSLLFLLFTTFLFSQNVEVKGLVVDQESGIPIIGANVAVKNSNQGAVTDFDGNFTISNVPVGAVLSISYLGYVTTEVVVNNASFLEIKLLTDVASLDEVVVVGYGTQKKSVVTGAISSVRAAELDNLPIERVEQALQGRVSGVVVSSNSGQPGSDATVRVRGITTFDQNGGNNPLWVIDGVIVDQTGIGYLNESDIASIEVLKDAASLAIYGARAASGVIMVTTKQGKSGKLSFSYNGFVGVSSPEKKLDLLNAPEYAALMNERSVASGGAILYPNINAFGVGTDWQDLIFEDNAIRTNHEFSISGGNDVSTFFASFGLSDQEGIITSEVSRFNKKNIRLNSNHKLSKYITVGQTLGYAHKRSQGVATNGEFGGVISSALNLDPLTPAVITDPDVANNIPYSNNPVLRDENGNPYGISSLVGQEMTNPLAFVKTMLGNYGWSDDFVGNAFVEFAPIEGLTFKTSVGGKLAYYGNESFTPVFYLSPTFNRSNNVFARGRNKTFAWNIENVASYSKIIGNHDFTLLVGQGTYVDNITSGVGVAYFDIPATSFKEASFNFSTPTENITAGAYDGVEHRVTSLFSRLNYNYDGKYLFTGVIRRDGSSRFGKNNRFGIFPSFSAGWVADQENFWPENKVINRLKIRGGYGVTGNDAIGDFGYLALVSGGRNYTFGNNPAESLIIGFSPTAPDNPDLKWEETSQLNVGFESKFFNKIDVTFDYFIKKTSGILQPSEIPAFVGAEANPLANVADMENKGLELELGYRQNFGDFNLKIGGNVSYIQNEITFLGEGKEFIGGSAGFQGQGTITRTQVGESYNSFYGLKTDGIFQNVAEINAYTNSTGGLIQPNASPGDFRWVDVDGDGSIGDGDKTILGSPLPDFTFGLTLNLSYKNFDFMAFAQGAAGNKIFQGLRRLDILNANYQKVALSRWTGEGSTNSYPRLVKDDPNGNFSRFSDFYLEDGDYVRLKTIQFGFTLPSEAISSIGLQKVRVFITGENIITFTDYSGYDPEIGGNVLGIDKGYYPQARSFMMGVNLQF